MLLNIAKIRLDLPNIQSIGDMGSPLYSDGSISMGLCNEKWTNVLSIKFLGAFYDQE
jgi:hypothetical protein